MEKILKCHDKERLRRAMLEQEETFRLQVHELHRLYRVQKQLMKEMRSNKFSREHYCNIPKNLEVRSVGAEAHIQHDDVEEMEAESKIVLTLAIGNGRRKRAEDGNTWDSAGSFSASSAESGTKKRAEHGWGMSAVQDKYLINSKSSERNYEFDMKKPPWLLPCLSLSMS